MTRGGEVLLSIENASLGYEGVPVLKGVNLEIRAGIFYGVVGPNGVGKTTLLRALLGLIKPLSGKVIRKARALRFGYVPQRETVDEIYPLTVEEIVAMGRYPISGPLRPLRLADRRRIWEAMEELEIAHLARQFFRELSGGQKQRTLIARALVADPAVMILDEPTNGMDLKAERSIMEWIRRFHARGNTVVMVTHLLSLVADNAQVLVIIDGGINAGPSQEILDEKNLSRTYGVPVRVQKVAGHYLIFAEGDSKC